MAPRKVIGSGLPIPEVYGERQAAAQRAFEQAMAELSAQERQQSLDFGLRDTGGNIEIDPTLSHGLAQKMLRGHSSSLMGARSSMSGRGLGKAGLSRQRERLLRFLQSGETSELANRFTRGKQGFAAQRGALGRGRDDAFNQAESDAILFALQNGLFNTDPTMPDGGVGGMSGPGINAAGYPENTSYADLGIMPDPITGPDKPAQIGAPEAGWITGPNNIPPLFGGGQEALLGTMAQAYDPEALRRQQGGTARMRVL